MGKGNFILGTGSSSIGDVTFARRNGQQIARVRVRKIKNPKSYGQAEQRMISAEVVKFYSPLSGVLETSFEGLSKSESYAKFLSINMNLARANGWAVKKGSEWIPLPFQLSAGSMPQPILNNTGSTINLKIDGLSGVTTWGDVSRALVNAYGLQNGDQITAITIWKESKPRFIFTRIYIDTESEEPVPSTWDTNGGISYNGTGGGIKVGAAFIFSRYDNSKQEWQRSTSFVACSSTYLAEYTGDANLAAAVASYMKAGGRTPVSDVYLNGHDDE